MHTRSRSPLRSQTPSPWLLLLARLHAPWPLPALLAWACGWAVWQWLLGGGCPAAVAWLAGLASGAALALATCIGRWRLTLATLGFPLSTLALGGLPELPAWAWLLAALPSLMLYPVGAWRDAPLFPTPAGALKGLNRVPGLAEPRRLLDAGCGLGHGLLALRAQWPQAQCEGLERSRVLRLAAAQRCPWARLQGGDMWAASWAAYDLVYLFQRPESMARAWAKAQQDLAPGSWLVSLEFEVPGQAAYACLQAEGQRPVWVYRVGVGVGVGVGAQPQTAA